jgi:hypothetical protein
MTQQKASFDATAQQLNARMDEVLAAGTGDGATEVADARVDVEGKAYESLGAHVRDILPRAHDDAAEVFESKMAEKYDAGIFHMEKYNLHENKLFYAYTSSIFSGWVSQYEVPANLTVTELRFYITARETAVTKVRVTIAVGEKTDSAICFQTYLDVDIQPEEEQLVSCLIPHVRLQEGETIFIGVDCNAISSQGFGYKEYDESVSWYVSNGAFRSLSDYSNGSHKKLYMEMVGFTQGIFTTDHLLDIAENHEGRISDVEEWGALVDEFEKEPIHINVQNPLPVITPTERYDYSTFTGWSCPIGKPTDFDTLIFTIRNRNQEEYLENVRCFITEDDRSGAVLIDEVMSDVHIAPGANVHCGIGDQLQRAAFDMGQSAGHDVNSCRNRVSVRVHASRKNLNKRFILFNLWYNRARGIKRSGRTIAVLCRVQSQRYVASDFQLVAETGGNLFGCDRMSLDPLTAHLSKHDAVGAQARACYCPIC